MCEILMGLRRTVLSLLFSWKTTGMWPSIRKREHVGNSLSFPSHPSSLSWWPKYKNEISRDKLSMKSPVLIAYPWNLEQINSSCLKTLSSGVISYIASSYLVGWLSFLNRTLLKTILKIRKTKISGSIWLDIFLYLFYNLLLLSNLGFTRPF